MSSKIDPTILGFNRMGKPLRETPRGAISTRAFIMCEHCRKPIKSNGGPDIGSTCVECAHKHRMILLEKEYGGESICDVHRDMEEAFDAEMTQQLKLIPQDEHGFQKGTFHVIIQWHPEDE